MLFYYFESAKIGQSDIFDIDIPVSSRVAVIEQK